MSFQSIFLKAEGGGGEVELDLVGVHPSIGRNVVQQEKCAPKIVCVGHVPEAGVRKWHLAIIGGYS